MIQAALAEEVRAGKVVYQGHVGHLLLKGGGPVFRVRVIAPLDFRVSMAQHRLKLTRNEVITYIRKIDQDRKKWAHYLYGVDWEDASLYDLVINLHYVDIEDACGIVATAVRKQTCFQFDAGCQAGMDDLARASRIKADIALNLETSDLELEVVSKSGVVRISGRTVDADQIAEIRRIAGKATDINKLNLDQLKLKTPD